MVVWILKSVNTNQCDNSDNIATMLFLIHHCWYEVLFLLFYKLSAKITDHVNIQAYMPDKDVELLNVSIVYSPKIFGGYSPIGTVLMKIIEILKNMKISTVEYGRRRGSGFTTIRIPNLILNPLFSYELFIPRKTNRT
ncbi:hypothetical protein RhiirB3_385076 [Rhizophagus irregularis]|nr:hypothetical protein RhiirB3_385076 [Rhizophagus irregularis]